MSALGSLARCCLFIKYLKRHKYATVEQLKHYYEKESKYIDGLNGVEQRTIQRDKNEIRALFGIDIAFKNPEGYYIKEDDSAQIEQAQKMLLNFDLLNAVRSDSAIHKFILPEHHRPTGSEQIPELLIAIRQQHPVEFDYTNVRDGDSVKHHRINPHFLKESQERWYLLGANNGRVIPYGIDRISNLVVDESATFEREPIDIASLHRDCFGIWDDPKIPVEEIELSYDERDGKFLKSRPLHHSQKILADTPEEFRITVKLRITNDFVMELLSRSRSLTVIRPASLRERVRQVYAEALKRNS